MKIGLSTFVMFCSISLLGDSNLDSVPSLGSAPVKGADGELLLEPSELRGRIEAGEAEEVLTLATEVIAEIEENRTRYDEALVKPLIVFGDASRELGEYIDAINAYERAKQISRLSNGLNSIEQVEAVHREAETYLELGHIGDANDSYEYIFSIYNRQFEPFSVDLLPTIFMLADWYVLIYNVFAARGLYEYATEIVDHHLERTSPENIRALQGLADTYRLERFRPLSALGQIQARIPVLYWADETPFRYHAKLNDFETGEEVLIELVKIELERPDSTPESIARAKLQLADWFTLFEKNEQAVVIYQDILATFENAESEFLNSEFGDAVPLFLPLSTSPDPQPLRLESPPITAEVGFTVDVDETGRVIQVQLDSARPQSVLVKEFEESLKNAIYRPRFEDGEPKPRGNVKVHHTYIFFPKTD
ncbi:MAG: hypothetical protein F4077_11235 [Gammaproteobacteria bacterium]|nr:hypothetical protein [Gammaproteobacteria bacterium]